MRKRLFILVAAFMLLALPVWATPPDLIIQSSQELLSDQIPITSPIKSVNIIESGYMQFTHRAADGSILYHGLGFNSLADEGEQQMLDVYLRNATNPANFYLRLYNTTPGHRSDRLR